MRGFLTSMVPFERPAVTAGLSFVLALGIDLASKVLAIAYDVDGTVSITCAASDALSGIASSTCANVSGPAYLFNIGTNIITATATDNAGNVASATYSFTVTATIGGLERFACGLLGTGLGKPKQLADLCRKLSDDLEDAQTAADHGDTKKRDENIRKFLKDAANNVGKLITTQQMVILTRIAQSITG